MASPPLQIAELLRISGKVEIRDEIGTELFPGFDRVVGLRDPGAAGVDAAGIFAGRWRSF